MPKYAPDILKICNDLGCFFGAFRRQQNSQKPFIYDCFWRAFCNFDGELVKSGDPEICKSCHLTRCAKNIGKTCTKSAHVSIGTAFLNLGVGVRAQIFWERCVPKINFVESHELTLIKSDQN